MIRRLLFCLSLLFAYPALSCGGGGFPPFTPVPGVLLLPTVANVVVGQTEQFTATVQNDTSGLAWSVDGGDAFGTVDSTGLYTAPATIPTGGVATVRVRLVDNTSIQDTSEVNILAGP